MPRAKVLGEGLGEPLLTRRGSPKTPPKELFQERSLARLWRDEGPRRHIAVRRRPEGPASAAPFLVGSPEGLGRRLDRAGDARFRARVRSFQLQAAQLLGSEVGAAVTSSLQERWRATALAPAVAAGSWAHFRIRPHNRPVRRLLGMAHLLERTWEEGLLSAMLSAVPSGTVAGLLAALSVGTPPGDGRKAALLGASRAGEMAVNVLLPFCAAWAATTGDRRLRASSWSLYRAWPALPENEITREMRARLGAQCFGGSSGETDSAGELKQGKGGRGGARNTARRQQGMIHLYKQRVGIQSL